MLDGIGHDGKSREEGQPTDPLRPVIDYTRLHPLMTSNRVCWKVGK
jgi:hypothetical protein